MDILPFRRIGSCELAQRNVWNYRSEWAGHKSNALAPNVRRTSTRSSKVVHISSSPHFHVSVHDTVGEAKRGRTTVASTPVELRRRRKVPKCTSRLAAEPPNRKQPAVAGSPSLLFVQRSALPLEQRNMELARLPVRRLAAGQGPSFVVRFTGDGKYCLVAGQDRTIRLYNPHRADPDKEEKRPAGQLEEGLLVKSYAGPHGYEVLDVAVLADNSRFASCGEDKAAFLWDVSTGTVVRRMQGHEQRINACCFSSEGGSVLFTASYDKTVRAWDMRSRNRSPIQTLEGCKDSATSVSATPSGDEVVVGCVDGKVRTYDLRAANVHEDDVHAPVTHTSVSHDGKCLLVTCLGGIVRLLEKASGAQLNSYTGHAHDSYRMESWLTNTDAHVISGSEDGQVHIWDIVESKITRLLKHHTRPVCSLSYHPTEPLLLTASYDGSAVIWGP